MKKVLVVNYSQSGQLDEIMTNFIEPFVGVTVDRIALKPVTPFPFPWTTENFFDIMPETVLEEAIDIEPVQYQFDRYDLIVLGYQPWFLSPPLPVTSLLQSDAFQKRLMDTPVVTVIGSRNMWLNSQESVKAYIKNAGGKLVANIPLIDRVQNHISAVTILHWMLTGRKDRKWGIFPKPGVSDRDIAEVREEGQKVFEAFKVEDYRDLQVRIMSGNKFSVPTDILFIEGKAKRLFRIWAGIIKKRGKTPAKRAFWVKAFNYYLVVALFGVAPVLLLVYNLLIRPFTQSSIQKKKKYFCSVEN